MAGAILGYSMYLSVQFRCVELSSRCTQEIWGWERQCFTWGYQAITQTWGLAGANATTPCCFLSYISSEPTTGGGPSLCMGQTGYSLRPAGVGVAKEFPCLLSFPCYLEPWPHLWRAWTVMSDQELNLFLIYYTWTCACQKKKKKDHIKGQPVQSHDVTLTVL